MSNNKTIVAGWRAIDHGFQPGTQPEVKVYEQQGKKGGKFYTIKLTNPFEMTDNNQNSQTYGQKIWVEGTTFKVSDIMGIVDRLNYILSLGFGGPSGMFVFQPGVQGQHQQAMPTGQIQGSGYGQPQQQYGQQQQVGHQAYGYQPNPQPAPQQPQGGSYQPPVTPNGNYYRNG